MVYIVHQLKVKKGVRHFTFLIEIAFTNLDGESILMASRLFDGARIIITLYRSLSQSSPFRHNLWRTIFSVTVLGSNMKSAPIALVVIITQPVY